MHGACGFWGVLAVGAFARPQYAYNTEGRHGFLYASVGDNPSLIGAQIVALIIEILWVVIMSTLMFGGLKAAGMLRVPTEIEEMGMDVSKHGGDAYELQAKP